MTGKVIRIERVEPRDGITEEPEFGPKGYLVLIASTFASSEMSASAMPA